MATAVVMNPLPYRKCVAAVIFTREGKLIIGERYDLRNTWQFPQGGVKENESYLDAVYREVEEEYGIPQQNLEFAGEIEPILKYEVHSSSTIAIKHCGQAMKWFVFMWKENDLNKLKIDRIDDGDDTPEFAQVKFSDWEELLRIVIPTKKEIYTKLHTLAQPLIEKHLNHSSQ